MLRALPRSRYFRRRALGKNFAAIEHHDGCAAQHDAHVVLDEEYGEPKLAVQLANHVDDARRLGMRETRHRLVEHNQHRIGRKAHRDLAQALAAVRKFGDGRRADERKFTKSNNRSAFSSIVLCCAGLIGRKRNANFAALCRPINRLS